MSLLYKFPGTEEIRTYGFDFQDQPEIVSGETLTGTPTVTITRLSGSGTLTNSSASILGTQVLFSLSGGSFGDRYQLVCSVITSGGSVIAAKGELKIDRI